MYKTNLNKTCRLQNKAVQLISGGKWCESAAPYYSKSQILKFKDLYRLELT